MFENIKFTCRLLQEDDVVVAVCPEFNVSSYGDTSEEAVVRLNEAMKLFFGECKRMGTLDLVLAEAGYGSAQSHPRQPQIHPLRFDDSWRKN